MANRTLTYLDRLAAVKSDDRALQVELARGYLQLGDVLGNPFEPNLGQTGRSLEAYRKGLAIITPVAAGWQDKVAQTTLARTLMQLAGAQTFLGKPAEQIAQARQAAELFHRLADAHPQDVDLLLSAGLADQFLARNLTQQSGWIAGVKAGDEVFTHLDRSAARIRRALELQPGQGRAYRMLAGTLQVRGNAWSVSDAARGRDDHRAALAVLDQQPAAEQKSREGRKVRASILLNLAWGLGTAREFDQCQAMLKEAIQVLRQLADDDPNDMAALYQVAIPLRTSGIFYARAGRSAEAVASYREENEILDRLIAKDTRNRVYAMYRAEAAVRGGAELAKLGNLAEAASMGQPGLRYYEELADDPAAKLQALLDAARWRAQMPPPLQDFRRSLAYAQRADRLSNGTSWEALDSLAAAHWGLGQREQAIAALRRGLALEITPSVRAQFERILKEYTSKGQAPR